MTVISLVQWWLKQLILSHAEITQSCDDAIKEAILDDKSIVTTKLLLRMIHDRQSSYRTRRGE